MRGKLLEAGDALSLVVPVIVTLACCLPLLLKYPSPGGDEPGFVDVAYTFATRGSLSTNAYLGLLPGAEHHVYWQPPLYFITLGGWLRAFGTSLTSARGFSLVWALVTVALVYLLTRRSAPRTPAMIASMLFGATFWVTSRASSARMDMMCVALTVGSVFIYLIARDRNSKSLHCLGGFVAGLALTTHPLGAIAIVTLLAHETLTAGWSVLRSTRTHALLGGCAIVLIVWGVYIAQDPETFVAQMMKQLERKSLLGSYWHQFRIARTHALTFVVSCGAGIWLIQKSWRDGFNAVVAVAFAASFAMATFGRENGYFVYFYPFACIAVGIALASAEPFRIVMMSVVPLAFLNEAVVLANDIRRYHHRDYEAVSRVVLDVVPPGATVFIADPLVTPYFSLVGRNPMRIAVPTPTEPYAHRQVALESDYIAMSIPSHLVDVHELATGLTPLAVVDQGPGYRLEIYRSPRAAVPNR